jgi:MoxR-like ATPase
MQRLTIRPGDSVTIPSAPGTPEQAHVFSEREILAIETALAARRALLVRGEPGTGKTQLARAAAMVLKRAFVSFVIDSRSESRDLLWHFDAVARLADAQVYGALLGRRGNAATPGTDEAAILKDLKDKLAAENFIHPRALWWGLDWSGAVRQAARVGVPVPVPFKDCDPGNGVVVLIDEIDKADSEVPNGLLEALGAGEFSVPGREIPVRPEPGSQPPLVIVTTNEERNLPDAFVRRCVVLHLKLPTNRQDLIDHLMLRGRAHFPDTEVADDVLREAASLLARDRDEAVAKNWFPRPGQAEFMDLVRAVRELAGVDADKQRAELARVAAFALRKHLGAED